MKTKRSMIISLIGRPNVGKSSLFNRLMRKANKSITFDTPGVTRDRHYGIATFDDIHSLEEKEAILVDTGGFYPQKVEEDEKTYNKFFNIMADHAHMAIQESDLILFVVDIREGALPFDREIADTLRASKKKFWILLNKFDTEKQNGDEADFYSLGLGQEEMFLVSASHGRGIHELREKLHREIISFESKLSSKEKATEIQKGVTPREQVISRVALIGAPNAGKSTLLNQLIGAQRALVSDVPGTTVDPIEGFFDLYFGKEARYLEEEFENSKNDGLLLKQYEEFRKNNPDVYNSISMAYELEEEGPYSGEVLSSTENKDDDQKLYDKVFTDNEEESATEATEKESYWRSIHLIDTAGIRKKKDITGFIESQSVYRSLRCITESDIVLYMVDATKGIGHQDRRLLDIALEKGKSVVICLNKIDLLKEKMETEKERKEWLLDLRDQVPWLDFCDLIPISAKYNKGINRLKNSLKKTIRVRKSSIPTGELNRFVFDLIEKNPVVVARSGGTRLKVKYASMVKNGPPTFLFYTNRSKGIPENYKRYLKNSLRRGLQLDNTPIHLIFRTGTDLEKREKKMGKKIGPTS